MIVDTAAFVAFVEDQILAYEPTAVISPELRKVWGAIADTLNDRIVNPTGPRPVIDAALGAGKSTCAKAYCALTPREHHPGILVVVRTKDQADEYVRDINDWSGDPRLAVALHSSSEARKSLGALASYPVVVVCHAGYEIGLDRMANSETYPPFDAIQAYLGAKRRLILIDEAMDQLQEARVSRAAIKQLAYDVPPAIELRHRDAMRVVDTARKILMAADNEHRAVFDDEAWREIATEESDLALLRLWESIQDAKKLYSDARRRRPDQEKKQNFGRTVAALRRQLYRVRFRWLHGAGPSKTSIMGGNLLLPPLETVVLDATGALNNVYRELPEEYRVLDMPKVRNYEAVVTRVQFTDEGTGKATVTKKGDILAKAAIDGVLRHYGPRANERHVLVVSHLAGVPHFEAYGTKAGFADYKVAHYGAIDGRNDWRDFDTLVVPSLLHTDPASDLLAYQELRGHQLDAAGLNAPPDAVKMISETKVTAALAQAFGRIRLRKMIDADGRCAPCDVFVRMPSGTRDVVSARIVAALQLALPGLTVTDWTTAVSMGDGTTSNAGQAYATVWGGFFISYLGGMAPGDTVDMATVRSTAALTTIGVVNDRTWDRVMRELRNPATALGALARAFGGRVGTRAKPGKRCVTRVLTLERVEHSDRATILL
jgi:hypothetical protein